MKSQRTLLEIIDDASGEFRRLGDEAEEEEIVFERACYLLYLMRAFLISSGHSHATKNFVLSLSTSGATIFSQEKEGFNPMWNGVEVRFK